MVLDYQVFEAHYLYKIQLCQYFQLIFLLLNLFPEYSRCVRITRDQKEQFKVDPKALVEDAEKELFKALEKAEAIKRAPGSVDDFLNAFLPMIPAVKKFFDDVLVMDEDKKLQHNRLGLLQRISALADGVADMSRLEGF